MGKSQRNLCKGISKHPFQILVFKVSGQTSLLFPEALYLLVLCLKFPCKWFYFSSVNRFFKFVAITEHPVLNSSYHCCRRVAKMLPAIFSDITLHVKCSRAFHLESL